MVRKFAVLSLALVAGFLAACGGQGAAPGGMGGPSYALPSLERDLAISATLPRNAIGEDLPTVLGTIKVKSFKDAAVGGFTQTRYSQMLGFPPKTVITIHNLSKTTPHTFNVVEVLNGTASRWPSNPTLLTTAHGGDKLGAGYRSGVIQPGKSVRVRLDKEGMYLIGCAFHYHFGMRDILIVKKNAHPGPQATPPPSNAPSPSPSSSGGGGGWQPPN